jgi:hypothetical protein
MLLRIPTKFAAINQLFRKIWRKWRRYPSIYQSSRQLALISHLRPINPARRRAFRYIGSRAAEEADEDGVDERIAAEVPGHYRRERDQQAGDKSDLRAPLPVKAEDGVPLGHRG